MMLNLSTLTMIFNLSLGIELLSPHGSFWIHGLVIMLQYCFEFVLKISILVTLQCPFASALSQIM